jgi:23S rRNA (uracil1939-C5)-methyltransferase
LRARFHAGPGGFGFYREGTHSPCDPAETGQLLDATVAVVRELSRVVRADRHHGITALELAENCPATERSVHVEARALDAAGLRRLAVAGITGVTGARMADPGTVVVHGHPTVRDEIAVDAGDGRVLVQLQRSARAFFQGNRYLLAPLVNRVVRWTNGERVADLYAGVGLFATALAAAGRTTVVAVEGDAVSSQDLQLNARAYDGSLRAVHARVEDYLRGWNPVEGATAIVDPPRTGLSTEARERLLTACPSRLVYVSCDAATLARDLRSLVGSAYDLVHLEAFDLFPNTAHVESLAVLDRRHARA